MIHHEWFTTWAKSQEEEEEEENNFRTLRTAAFASRSKIQSFVVWVVLKFALLHSGHSCCQFVALLMARHKNALKKGPNPVQKFYSYNWLESNNCGNDCHSFFKLKWCFNEGHRPICLQFEVELDVQLGLRDTIRLSIRDFPSRKTNFKLSSLC